MSLENAVVHRCEGTIAEIDIANRALVIEQPGGYVQVLNVAPGCQVHLNGEQVRLRLLVARDMVEVCYFEDRHLHSAVEINVLNSRRSH